MEATRIRLAEGVHLTYLPARKFKTSLLSAQFVTPLRRETAGANALLAAVLRRGTVSCPDMGALSAKMDNLYDASIDYTVRKKGENQCVGFVASFIDDRYAPDGERLLEPAAALLGAEGEMLDYAVRYCPSGESAFRFSDYADVFEAILKTIIEHGKGIEINTGSLYKNMTYAHPHPSILKLYKELGGEIITVGSDAHIPKYIGYDFETYARDILTATGFRYYCTFEQMKPVFHKL